SLDMIFSQHATPSPKADTSGAEGAQGAAPAQELTHARPRRPHARFVTSERRLKRKSIAALAAQQRRRTKRSVETRHPSDTASRAHSVCSKACEARWSQQLDPFPVTTPFTLHWRSGTPSGSTCSSGSLPSRPLSFRDRRHSLLTQSLCTIAIRPETSWA